MRLPIVMLLLMRFEKIQTISRKDIEKLSLLG